MTERWHLIGRCVNRQADILIGNWR